MTPTVYTKRKPLRAWHFLDGDKLRDGTTAPPDGVWLDYPGKPVMCWRGLHFSTDVRDALSYSPGTTLCLVDCAGQGLILGDDKGVCNSRRIVARMDSKPLLLDWARWCVLSVLHLAPEMLEIVYNFLLGDDSTATATAARYAATAAIASAAAAAAADAAYATYAAADAATASAAYVADAADACATAARYAATAYAAAADADAAAAAYAAKNKETRTQLSLMVNDAFQDWI